MIRRVLCVCDNGIRSVIMKAILQRQLEAKGASDFSIEQAVTNPESKGAKPDQHVVEALQHEGLEATGEAFQLLTEIADLTRFSQAVLAGTEIELAFMPIEATIPYYILKEEDQGIQDPSGRDSKAYIDCIKAIEASMDLLSSGLARRWRNLQAN